MYKWRGKKKRGNNTGFITLNFNEAAYSKRHKIKLKKYYTPLGKFRRENNLHVYICIRSFPSLQAGWKRQAMANKCQYDINNHEEEEYQCNPAEYGEHRVIR